MLDVHSNFGLTTEPWIPFRRRSGHVDWGSPALIVDALDDDPVVALACPRADFDGAVSEFLIGLYTVAMQVEDDEEWRHWHDQPPAPPILASRLAELQQYFFLDGDGPRFMQDFDALDFVEVEETPIEQMLIDAAGAQTQRLNKDLFVKRQRVQRLSRAGATMALITLQTYAPSGGQGHRTSMRGGGPLTTLIDPRVDRDGIAAAHRQPLWRQLWANAQTLEQASRLGNGANAQWPLIFPWLSSTRVSKRAGVDVATFPDDAHPFHAYFGSPRRIRLCFDEGGGVCDLTGQHDAVSVSAFRMLNFGVKYEGWRHPLTPYYRDAKGALLPLHGQPDGAGWKDWAGLVVAAQDEEEPSLCVAEYLGRRSEGRALVRVFGYDMDNMKARGWVDATLPAWAIGDDRRRVLARLADRLTKAAEAAASLTFVQIRAALFKTPQDAKGDFSRWKADFWSRTEAPFYAAIGGAASSDLVDDLALAGAFIDPIRAAAFGVFDDHVGADSIDLVAARRIVVARSRLAAGLYGNGKLGGEIYRQLMPQEMPARKAKKAKATQ